MDESLEDAAMDLGGRPLAVFFDVTVPLLLPALVSGWLLAFTLSLDDLVISSFVSGPGATTLPMLIFSKVRLGVTPDINAITTIIIVLVALAVTIAALLSRRRRVESCMSDDTGTRSGPGRVAAGYALPAPSTRAKRSIARRCAASSSSPGCMSGMSARFPSGATTSCSRWPASP